MSGLTETLAVCSGNPDNFLSVCSVAPPAGALKTKQSPSWINNYWGQRLSEKVLDLTLMNSKVSVLLMCT